MRYQIAGKQIDVGEALQTHVKSELGETFEKYAQRPTDAIVVFSRDASNFHCETTVHLSTGLTVAAKGQSHEVYAAFEAAREIIIAETEAKILSLSVGEAVMHMELGGAPFLVFRNEKHGGVNVVYRRDDKNVGWIDPPAQT